MLKWTERANLTMNIDDLYFVKKPFPFLTSESFGNYITYALATIAINTAIVFFLTWITYVGSFYIISSISHQKIGSWRQLFTVIGYVFIIAIFGVLVRVILFLSLPGLSFPLSSWPPLTTDDSIRAGVAMQGLLYPNTVYRLTFLASPNPGVDEWVIDLWIAALCAVSMRVVSGLSWRRAAMFAGVAFFIKLFLFGVWLIT